MKIFQNSDVWESTAFMLVTCLIFLLSGVLNTCVTSQWRDKKNNAFIKDDSYLMMTLIVTVVGNNFITCNLYVFLYISTYVLLYVVIMSLTKVSYKVPCKILEQYNFMECF